MVRAAVLAVLALAGPKTALFASTYGGTHSATFSRSGFTKAYGELAGCH